MQKTHLIKACYPKYTTFNDKKINSKIRKRARDLKRRFVKKVWRPQVSV